MTAGMRILKTIARHICSFVCLTSKAYWENRNIFLCAAWTLAKRDGDADACGASMPVHCADVGGIGPPGMAHQWRWHHTTPHPPLDSCYDNACASKRFAPWVGPRGRPCRAGASCSASPEQFHHALDQEGFEHHASRPRSADGAWPGLRTRWDRGSPSPESC